MCTVEVGETLIMALVAGVGMSWCSCHANMVVGGDLGNDGFLQDYLIGLDVLDTTLSASSHLRPIFSRQVSVFSVYHRAMVVLELFCS